MSLAAMKPLLARSKKEPVNCAFALTAKKEGILLLDKKMKPKQLMAELKKKATKLKLDLDNQTMRFGRAEVDSEENPTLLNFIVNKDTGNAVRVKLLEHVKKAGFAKLELKVDDGFDAEPDSPEPDAAEGVPPTQATSSPPQAADGAAPPAPPAASPAPSDPAPPAADASSAPPPPADTGALTRTLMDLAKQIPQADPARQTELKGIAVQAQAALKGGDAAGANAAIQQLQTALGSSSTAPATGASPAPPGANAPAIDAGAKAAFAKARLVWLAARKKVEADVASLQKELSAAFKDHPDAPKLEAGFTARIEKVMSQLDEELSDKLDEAANATDPARHAKLVGEAKGVIQRYQAFLANDRTLADIDANPFVPVTIEKTMMGTLSVLARTIA
jgi:hypothetical protein